MSLLGKPITYRQTTISFAPRNSLPIDTSKLPLHSSRMNGREFGKDITNLNLTVCQEYNKTETSGFLKAFESIKENQAKGRKQNTNKYSRRSYKKSQKDTEKQIMHNTKIPMFIHPIPKNDSSKMEIDQEPLIKPILTSNVHEQSIISDNVNYFNSLLNTNKNNPQYVPEYQDEIFTYLKGIDKVKSFNPDYMHDVQDDINDKMRAILLDWLVDVNLKFKLLPQTLFLTVNIIDRYLSFAKIKRSKLQLVGVAALFIACKYEEIYPPELKLFVYITDNAYQKKDVLDMEYEILKTLEFEITVPTALNYLDFIVLRLGMTDQKVNQVKYLLELSLINGKMKKYSSEVLAVSAAIAVNKEERERIIEMFSGYILKQEIVSCVRDIYENERLVREGYISLKAVKNKYSLEKYGAVAKLKLQ